MRVTQQMLHQNSVRHMNQNLSRFEKTNSQVSSGKLLERPSDNPNGVSKAMNLKSTIAENEQFTRNTDEAKLWLDETDQTMSRMTDVMQRVRELAVQGGSDTLSDHSREVISTEILELKSTIEQLSGTQLNGQDLLGAAKSFTIGNGLTVKANASSAEILGGTVQMLEDLAGAVKANTPVDLAAIDSSMDQMLTVQSEIGARTNRVDATDNRLKGSTLELTKMLSKIEDVDYAEAIIKLKSEESIYQASLSATSKIIQPSLMDFLR